MDSKADVRKRRILQWALFPIMVITILFGYWFPILGFTVPIVMIIGIAGGFFNGRYVCGNLCPRGSFFDRPMWFISRKDGKVPEYMKSMTFRWSLFAVLMTFMVYRISLNPTDINHLGRTFWMMCTITSALGIVLALVYHPRTWCSICPVGTFGNAIGGHKNQLRIDSAKCRECGICEKACPMGLEIVRHKRYGVMSDRDCVKCSECSAVCPCRALEFESGYRKAS